MRSQLKAFKTVVLYGAGQHSVSKYRRLTLAGRVVGILLHSEATGLMDKGSDLCNPLLGQ